MTTVQRVAVIIAATGLATALFMPGRKTAEVTTAFFNGLSKWNRTAITGK